MADVSTVSEKVYALIKAYFSNKKWKELAEAVQTRYLNMCRHYVEGKEIENYVPKPDFMIKKPANVEFPKTKLFKAPGKKIVKQKKKLATFDKHYSDKENERPQTQTRRSSSDEKVRRNPRRNVSIKNYFEEQEPAEDRYVFCDVCEKQCLDYCTKCGMLVTLENTYVKLNVEDRAMKTVPKGVLQVKNSPIHGLGVFALRDVNKGVRMGPYEGLITRVESTKGYSWKLKDGQLIDASDEKNSNYLRYVNCAPNISRQNLVAFQYKGNLYYRTCKNIKAGEELLVFYGNAFAKNLGIDTEKYFEPNYEDINSKVFCCTYCYIGLSTESYRIDHEKYCRHKYYVGDTFSCQICKCHCTTEDFLISHERYCRKRVEIMKKRTVKEKTKDCKVFVCNYCGHKFTGKRSCNNHILIVHNTADASKFRCKTCKFETYYKCSLNHHLKLHDEHIRFICKICKKGFKRKLYLDKHIYRKHTPMESRKKYKCEFCDYKTITASLLKQHQITHRRDERFQHKINSLMKDVVEFKCNECNFMSYRKGNLKDHLLIHSNFFPFRCTCCEKGFNWVSSLHRHMISKHPEMPRCKT